jgi:hypothetical protein
MPGFAKFICSGEGGDRVDADGNPLLMSLIMRKTLFLGIEGKACTRLTRACLWHQNVKNASFCR